MNKIKLLILIIASAFSAQAQDIADYKLEVLDFSALKVTDPIDVVYHCSEDSAGWAYFSCTPEVAQRLIFSNNKSQLHVQVDLADGFSEPLPTLHVYSSSLGSVENSSDSTIIVESSSPIQTFKLRVVGNGMIVAHNIKAAQVDAGINTGKGHVVVSGTASRVKLTNVGTGPVEAGNLIGETVKVILLGTGNIDCTATETLSVYGAGSGTVFYSGNPEKVTNRSLGVKAVEMASATASE